jgi:CRISPR system Cascade subunit CasD
MTSPPILLLRLEGPLQSWGSRSRWDVRDTEPEPTKSGLIGLIGCALGYPMGDRRLQDELDAGLRFGYRVESPGTLLEDFHTITGRLPTADGKARESTIISPRFYLEDAGFLVGFEETGTVVGLIERCQGALRDPVWPLFLGRKACIPTRPLLEAPAEAFTSLEDALRRQPWRHDGLPARRDRPRILAWIEAGASSGGRRSDRPEAIRTNAARQYDFVTMVELGVIAPPGVPEPKEANA